MPTMITLSADTIEIFFRLAISLFANFALR